MTWIRDLDPDPFFSTDPHQNQMYPKHWKIYIPVFLYKSIELTTIQFKI